MSAIVTNPLNGAVTRVPTELWTKILALTISAEERSGRPEHLHPTRNEFDELLRFEIGQDDDSTTLITTETRSERVWETEPTIALDAKGSPWQRTVRARKRLMLVCKKWSSEVFVHLYAHVYIYRAGQFVALVRTLQDSEDRARRAGMGCGLGYGQWARKITFQLVVLPHLVQVFGLAFKRFLELCPSLENIEHRDAVNEIHWYGESSGYVSPSAQIFRLCMMSHWGYRTGTEDFTIRSSPRPPVSLTSLSLATNEPLSMMAANAFLAGLRGLQSLTIALQDDFMGTHKGAIMSIWDAEEDGFRAGVDELNHAQLIDLPHLASLTLKDTTLDAIVEVTCSWTLGNLRRCAIDTFEDDRFIAGKVIEGFCIVHGGDLQELLVGITAEDDVPSGDVTEILRAVPQLQRIFLPRPWTLGPPKSEAFAASNLHTVVILLGDDGGEPFVYNALRWLSNRKYFPLLKTVRIIGDDLDNAFTGCGGYIGWPVSPDLNALREGTIPILFIEDCSMRPSRKKRIAAWIRLYGGLGIRIENQEGRQLLTRTPSERVADPDSVEDLMSDVEAYEDEDGHYQLEECDEESESEYVPESDDESDSDRLSEDDEGVGVGVEVDHDTDLARSFQFAYFGRSGDFNSSMQTAFVELEDEETETEDDRTSEVADTECWSSASDLHVTVFSDDSTTAVTSISSVGSTVEGVRLEQRRLSFSDWSDQPARYLEWIVPGQVSWDDALSVFEESLSEETDEGVE